MQGDEKSWHLLRVRNDGQIAGCARILVHPRDVTFSRLRIASSSAVIGVPGLGSGLCTMPWSPS